MDLFDYMRETQQKESTLASRMRPKTLDEVVGQKHIIGKNTMLYRAIKADKLSSVIFYGPPGTGKTTLAMVIANTTSAVFKELNATTAGKKDIEAVVKESKDNLGMYGKKTILFVDEIHRFNKAQQDYLLPFVEDGTLILIGATTENPYFEVNGALLSRSAIFELRPLSIEDMRTIIHRAVYDTERGLWQEEDVCSYEMASTGGQLYLWDTQALWAADPSRERDWQDPAGTETSLPFELTTGEMGLDAAENVYLSRLTLRLEAARRTRLQLAVSYDGGAWEVLDERVLDGEKKSLDLTFAPRRCGTLRLHLQGEGQLTLRSLAKTMSTAKGKIMEEEEM